MKTLYDVQEWLKAYGYVNLMVDRLDAIYFMKEEIESLHQHGILADTDKKFLTASVILRREARLEEGKKHV